MGILTDGRGRKQLNFIITKHCSKICVLSYFVGIIWLCALSQSHVNNRTYFSENALLPGQVRLEYDRQSTANTLMQELENMNSKQKESVPISWLSSKLSSIGLQTYTQNFTVQIPLPDSKGPSSIMGTNVYSVLRAPRIAGTEAIVFSLPYNTGKNLGALALMLSLAEHFRSQSYWSKDIIFLITDKGVLGMHAWLEAYHDIPNPYIKSLPLEGHSGSIQAAINIQMRSSYVDSFDILVEGVNGQLPNLDLINMVNRLCRMEGIPSKLHTQGSNIGFGYLSNELVSMVKMMVTQASGIPTGNHGLFHRYRIDSVTLRGVALETSGHQGFEYTGRVFEGIFRSLNNLMERFHQSFFFYLLPEPHRYVSIGLYMPPFCCLLLGPMITSVMLWVITGDPTVIHGPKNTEKTNKEDIKNDIKDKKMSQEIESKDNEKTKTEERTKNERQATNYDPNDTKMTEEIESKESKKIGTEQEENRESVKKVQCSEGTGNEDTKYRENESDKIKEFDIKDAKPSIDESTLREKVGFAWNPQQVSGVFPIVMVTYLCGALLYYSPYLGYTLGVTMEMDGLTISLVCTCFVLGIMVLIPLIHRILLKPASMANLYLVKCIALVLFLVTMASLGAMNFSLAFLSCLFTIPGFLVAGPTQSILRRFVQVFLLLVASPPSILVALCMAYLALFSDSATVSSDNLHFITRETTKLVYQAVMSALRDSHVLGTWSFSIACVGLMPNWTLFWYLAWQ